MHPSRAREDPPPPWVPQEGRQGGADPSSGPGGGNADPTGRTSRGSGPAARQGTADGGVAAPRGAGADARDTGDGPLAAVFDKDVFFREFQALLLSKQGFTVLAPDDPGAFTLEWLLKARPSLLITEVLIPGADGLDLVQAVKEHPALRNTFVIVFSVLNAESLALQKGADRFIQKPLMRDDFLRVIREAMRTVTNARDPP